MTQFLATHVNKSLGTINTWLDIDLSSDIPAGATGAIFRVVETADVDRMFGLRKKGSTDDRYKDIEQNSQQFFIIGVDENRKCEGKIENLSVDFWLIGYTEADATMLTNGVDKSLSSGGTWTDIDLSGQLPAGAKAAIFEVINNSGSLRMFGLRRNGSTDLYYQDLFATSHQCYVIGVDTNRKCQGKVESIDVDFYLVGYLTMGTTETNGVDRSIGSTGTYVDITESNAPAGATGVYSRLEAPSSGYSFAARKNGASDDVYKKPTAKHTAIFVGLDAAKKWEGKIESTAHDFYTLGYFSAGYTEKTKTSLIGLHVITRKTKNSSVGLTITTPTTKTSSIGLSVLETNTKTSSMGLTITTPTTKTSSIGLSVLEEKTKPSSIGLKVTVIGEETKTSFIGLSVLEEKTKTSSIGLTVTGIGTVTKVSSIGLRVVERKTKTSSIGIRVSAQQTKESSVGLSICTRKTKTSSVGLSIQSAGVTTFLDTYVNKSLGTINTWLDIDLSSNIPTTATGALIRVRNTADSWKKFGLRKNGSSDDRYGEMEALDQGYHIIAVDSNRKIEGKIESLSVDFYLMGYTQGDAVLFTNGIDKSISPWATWTDIDLSANVPVGTVAAIFEVHNTAAAPRMWSLRKKGSTDERYGDLCSTRCNTYIVGVDSNRKCEGKIEDPQVDFYLMGYFIDGTAKTNGVDRSLGTVDIYTDITESDAPAGATGVWIDYYTTQMTQKYAARKKGASEDPYFAPDAKKCMIFTPLDANKKWEGKIEHLANDWYTVGYFASLLEVRTKTSIVGLSIKAEEGRASIIGITVVNRVIKESSIGLTVGGESTKESSIGLAISKAITKVSSAGLSISEVKTKTSTVGLTIIEVPYRVSSIGLCVKGPNTKESSVGLTIIAQSIKASSISLAISGKNTNISSVGLTVYAPACTKGLFYGKLGDTILETVAPESFRISEEINKIPSFEFEVANSEVNRTAIAANPTALFKIYWQHDGVENHIFTGIINADGIEYVSLTNIKITGFSSYVKLGWPLYKHLNSEDAESVNTIFDFHGTYTDYTTEANNATTNDVVVGFGGVNHCFYVGEANPFWGLQIKYSTKGVPAGAVVVIEFSKGSGVWATLDVLDETNAFTEDAGTYDFIIAHPPSDWARNAVDGVSKYWLRWRVVSGAYTTSPKLDQIHTVNVDVYRVFYLATSARAILLDVLDGTEYSMDTTDTCPEDEINLFAEYESPLRVVAAIPAALTWTDGDGNKKAYQWWIDEAKNVHIKQKRGTTYVDDITGDLTIFNNLLDYFNISNRLIGFAKRDGLSQIRAIVENTASQTTHALRALAVPKRDVGKYLTLKESLQKDIAISKDPMQRLNGSVTTEFWEGRGYEVGDTVTLHQGEWVVDEGEFQIVKVDRGPILTQLNLGISREHLEGLKSNLKRAFDISNVQMHGSTSLLTAGPETSNYERKTGGEVFPSKLEIEIPSEVTKTHKVLLSWTTGPYRASVNDQTGDPPSHDHSGWAGDGGAITAADVGLGGKFTPDIGADGGFTPAMLGEAHTHDVELSMCFSYLEDERWFPDRTFIGASKVYGLNHRHSGGGTGGPSGTANAITTIYTGSACASGFCVVSMSTGSFATSSHTHSSGYTGYTYPSAYIDIEKHDVISDIQSYPVDVSSDVEDPEGHIHECEAEGDHDHTGVEHAGHSDHEVAAEAAHSDHSITSESPGKIDIDFGIHEEAAGTVLELLINDEKIGEYEGAQTEIRIDGYLTSGSNTIEIQPIAAETGKKGSTTISGSGILFVEPKRF